jgi:hypothetical protein
MEAYNAAVAIIIMLRYVIPVQIITQVNMHSFTIDIISIVVTVVQG